MYTKQIHLSIFAYALLNALLRDPHTINCILLVTEVLSQGAVLSCQSELTDPVSPCLSLKF